MTFEEFLDKACKSARLSATAKLQLPNTLSMETQAMVMRIAPDEFGKILALAIDKINHGSIESVDSLIRKSLNY